MKKFSFLFLLLVFLTACETLPSKSLSVSTAEASISSPPPVVSETSTRPSAESSQKALDLPIIPSRGNTAGNILNWGSVAQDGGFIYFINTADNRAVYKMPENGGEITRLNSSQSSYINVADGWVYYCNQDDGWKIYKMRIDGTQNKALNNRRSQDIQLVGDTVYFINGNIYAKKPGSLYTVKTDGTQEKQLINAVCQDINIDGDTIYYVNWSDSGKIYKTLTDGSQNQKLNDDACIDMNVLDGWIYYRNDKGTRGIYKIRTDGTGRTLLYKGNVYCLNVMDGFVYFCNWENRKQYPGPMFRLSVEGGAPELLNKADRCSDVNTIPGWIYYFVLGKNEVLYRMRIDGSERQKMG